MENKRKIFFSSDLMLALGKEIGTVKESNWNIEINNISLEQVPDPRRLEQLKHNLEQFNPSFIATGHGACINLK
jgi:hypothetical protein